MSTNMSSSCYKLMEAHDKRNLIEISQLIDLTDKPIGLTRDEIGWSRVRSNASNCICCCNNNSITLVTTDDSYILDHVPLDNIQFAQTNASLQYLALSNHRKIAIIDLVDNDINNSYNRTNNNLMSETKVVNLAAHNLTMNDIIFWRWLDDTSLVILSYEALYTCSVDQQHINHPAYTAFSNRSRYLSMQKIFHIQQNLSALCQVNDVQRDSSGNIYAISSLYSTNNLLKLQPSNNTHNSTNNPANYLLNNSNSVSGGTLRPSFGSMPGRLSQLVNNEYSSDSLRSEQHFFDTRRNYTSPTNCSDDEICGLVQIYCKARDRSQLIQAHAITFTNPRPMFSLSRPQTCKANEDKGKQPEQEMSTNRCINDRTNPTILVAANKIGDQMRVHFTEMATFENQPSRPGQIASPTTRFDHLSDRDFPTSIVCSHVKPEGGNDNLHVALVTTKHGQLFVCSVTHSTILFNTSITNDIISSSILENSTHGLMVICRNGQVLLVRLNLTNLLKLLDESKSLRHIKSASNILEYNNNNNDDNQSSELSNEKSTKPSSSGETNNQRCTILDYDSEVIISTRL